MRRFVFIFFVFFIGGCWGDEREPKLFFGPKPQTVYAYRRVPEFVTEFVPSSCIVIESTLPPCRHVRNLEIYPSVPTRITKTQSPESQRIEPAKWKPQLTESAQHAPTPPLRGRPQQIKYTSPNWNWNLFNIFRVQNFTYTSTKTEYITTRIQDPNTIVSFHIKGCKPSRLPFNLPECVKPDDVKNDNIIVMAPLKFISDDYIAPSRSENAKIEDQQEEEKQEPQHEQTQPKNETN